MVRPKVSTQLVKQCKTNGTLRKQKDYERLRNRYTEWVKQRYEEQYIERRDCPKRAIYMVIWSRKVLVEATGNGRESRTRAKSKEESNGTDT